MVLFFRCNILFYEMGDVRYETGDVKYELQTLFLILHFLDSIPGSLLILIKYLYSLFFAPYSYFPVLVTGS